MQYLSTPWLFVAVITASAVVFAVLWYCALYRQATQISVVQNIPHDVRLSTLLFRNETLVDSDCSLGKLPWSDDVEVSEWRHLRCWLGKRFGTLPYLLTDLKDGEIRDFPAIERTDPASLTLSTVQGLRRVELKDPTESEPSYAHRARAIETYVSRLSDVLNHSPCAIRVYDKTHETAWSNQRFKQFNEEQTELFVRASLSLETEKRIFLPAHHGDKERYLELKHLDQPDFQVLYVNDVTQVVQAEKARREFIQTLTKTFANLTTGLAVFDQNQRLVLFNPALLDMTSLSPSFLSSQPPMVEVFDRLRDSNMLPEPKNYGSWRNQINAMIKSASEGLYIDDWLLPNGMTYRITGRPHPDGAVAFLFEDISDEVALTRRFRSQIDLRQAALDVVTYAVAITGPNHAVLMCNRACTELFGIDPEAAFAEMALQDFLRICAEKLPHVWFWEACEKSIINRTELERVIESKDNELYLCKVDLLPGNATNISICRQSADIRDQSECESLTA